MTSYQKLKKRNAELADQLHELAIRPHSIKSQEIIAGIKFRHKLDEMVWIGDYSTNTKTQEDGILGQITR